jgi:prepilin-type N-terminal cleavage/methylation domain-containing protein
MQSSTQTSRKRLASVGCRTGHWTLNPQPSSRLAFTLIELLIVIAIIGILAGLVLNAVFNSIRQARVVAVVQDIKNLEKGIADFKLRHGVDIPSSIMLCEQSTGGDDTWSDTSGPNAVGIRRSRAIIQRIWPQFDFTYAQADTAGEHDINGDGDADDFLNLTGADCLVFFLGGMNNTYTDRLCTAGTEIEANRDDDLAGTAATPIGWTPIGFSPNPRFPFSREGATRVGPYEFDLTRFIAGNSSMPNYLDTIPGQQLPYLYASATSSINDATPATDNNGTYRPLDFNLVGAIELTDIYTQANNEPWNPKSYQLISPGFDFSYGDGGVYNGEAITEADRPLERDNIANFSSGEFGG